MKYQLKYKVTYGIGVQTHEVEVYAFDIIEAIEIANKIYQNVESRRISKVEQI